MKINTRIHLNTRINYWDTNTENYIFVLLFCVYLHALQNIRI